MSKGHIPTTGWNAKKGGEPVLVNRKVMGVGFNGSISRSASIVIRSQNKSSAMARLTVPTAEFDQDDERSAALLIAIIATVAVVITRFQLKAVHRQLMLQIPLRVMPATSGYGTKTDEHVDFRNGQRHQRCRALLEQRRRTHQDRISRAVWAVSGANM